MSEETPGSISLQSIPPWLWKVAAIVLLSGSAGGAVSGSIFQGEHGEVSATSTRLTRIEANDSAQDVRLGTIERTQEAEVRTDSAQNETLEFLKCARLADLGIEERSAKQCAADYVRRQR